MNSPDETSTRQGAVGALLAAGTGAIAGAGVILRLRPGIPFLGLDSAGRMKYLVDHQRGWTGGWILVGTAALALVNFYLALAWRWRDRSPQLCRLAGILSGAGLAADLAGISLWMLVAPGRDGAEFDLTERIAVALIFFLAKILYALSGILITSAGAHEWPRWLVGLSIPVWISGAALAAATLRGGASAQASALYSLAGFYILWSSLVGGWFLRRVVPPPEPAAPGFVPDPRD